MMTVSQAADLAGKRGPTNIMKVCESMSLQTSGAPMDLASLRMRRGVTLDQSVTTKTLF